MKVDLLLAAFAVLGFFGVCHWVTSALAKSSVTVRRDPMLGVDQMRRERAAYLGQLQADGDRERQWQQEALAKEVGLFQEIKAVQGSAVRPFGRGR